MASLGLPTRPTSWLYQDVDHDGLQEGIVYDNDDLWTGVIKWTGSALNVLWAAQGNSTGGGRTWIRRNNDVLTPRAGTAVAVSNPNGWTGVLEWQGSGLVLTSLNAP